MSRAESTARTCMVGTLRSATDCCPSANRAAHRKPPIARGQTRDSGTECRRRSAQESEMLANRFAMHVAIGALLVLPLWSSAHAERTVAAAPPGAGEGPVIEEVNFPISCSPTAQKAFNHAAWTLHSFWYPEALQSFSNIAK